MKDEFFNIYDYLLILGTKFEPFQLICHNKLMALLKYDIYIILMDFHQNRLGVRHFWNGLKDRFFDFHDDFDKLAARFGSFQLICHDKTNNIA